MTPLALSAHDGRSNRQVIRKHSRSFALAAALLPPVQRDRAEALYTWCRIADDRIDQAADPDTAQIALTELIQEVEMVYSGRPIETASAQILHRVVRLCQIPPEYPLELLAGFSMDVQGQHYETETELLLYCYRVAGVVGLMMCHALGVTHDHALPHAAHLGIAMQLTNIARDVAEDWDRGRLYLPREWFTIAPNRHQPLSDDRFQPAIRRCLDLADRYYQSGEAGLKYLAPRSRLGIAAAARLYQAIGVAVAARGCRPTAGRAIVSAPARIRILVQTCCRALPDLLRDNLPVWQPTAVHTFATLPLLESTSHQLRGVP